MSETIIGAAALRTSFVFSSLLAVTATVVSPSERERKDVDEAIACSVSDNTSEDKCSRCRRAGLAFRDTADNLFTGFRNGSLQNRT